VDEAAVHPWLSSTDNRRTIQGCLKRFGLTAAVIGRNEMRPQRAAAASGCLAPEISKPAVAGSSPAGRASLSLFARDSYKESPSLEPPCTFRAKATGGRSRPPHVVRRLSVSTGGRYGQALKCSAGHHAGAGCCVRPMHSRVLRPRLFGKVGRSLARARFMPLSVNCQSSVSAYWSVVVDQ
jgi:hypothetical protein